MISRLANSAEDPLHKGSAEWFRGLTLQERLERPGHAAVKPNFAQIAKHCRRVGIDSLLGLASLTPYSTTDFFRALGDTGSMSQPAPTPQWVDFWASAEGASHACAGCRDLLEEYTLPDSAAMRLFHPLLRACMHRVTSEFAVNLMPAGLALNSRRVMSSAAEWLLRELNAMLSRTLTLEVNCARLRRELRGNTPEERFESYLIAISSEPSRRAALFLEYPLLLRNAVSRIDRWASYLSELISRLLQEWQEIRLFFFGKNLLPISR
jgi:hypothetical protein